MSELCKTIAAMSLVVVSLWAAPAAATMYCGRTPAELTVNPGRPFNAVGFLSNGCTAFLIDRDHIVAAAHCFVNPRTGAWQRRLLFYPNFHPSRVAADPRRVPRADVVRAVVGSRAAESRLGDRTDWGIARVDNWRDTGGLDLTPVSLAPSIPAPGAPLVNPAYTRHHFPYNDSDAVTWDNMMWDNTNCRGVPPHGGIWTTLMRPAPFTTATQRDVVRCNSRWGAGMVHGSCTLAQDDRDLIVHNCDTVGGSSGSPIFHRSGGRWFVIGVGHGGGPTGFREQVPQCTPDVPTRRDNTAPSVARFRFAPRFASNVAVHRRPGNPRATAVFAVDSDMDRVVMRTRMGDSPSYTDSFTFWSSLGTPRGGAELTRVAACAADLTGRPQVFVVADESEVHTRFFRRSGVWSAWQQVALPAGARGVGDIDAAHDATGRCQLVMVERDGSAHALPQIADDRWGHWTTIACGGFRRVTGLNYAGTIWVVMLDRSGHLWRTQLSNAGWLTPTRLPNPGVAGAWTDIDMTWDQAGRGFMVAARGGGNRLWFMPMYGSAAWRWRGFDTHLWAPAEPPQDAPAIVSITGSRWVEDVPGTTSPVIFGTDDAGNVYFVEYTRVGNPRWVLDWKSFYHERIEY